MNAESSSGKTSRGIYWKRCGSGPLVTLVIGFGQDSAAWQGVVEELEETFSLLLIDNRGAGRSPNDDQSFTLDDLAADVVHVLAELDVSRTAIVGQSMGGAIGQLVALEQPELMSHLVTVNSFTAVPTVPRLAFEGIYELLTNGSSLDVVIANLAPWIYSGSFLSAPARLDQLVEAAAANPFAQTPEGYRAQLDALIAFDSSSRLSEIHQRTLVIGATEDLVAPMNETEALASGIANSEVVWLDTGHGSHIEAPVEVAREIRRFLS